MNYGYDEFLEKLEDLFVLTPYMEEIIEDIDEAIRIAQVKNFTKQPTCILVTGNSGAGKTTLREYYEGKYPRKSVPTPNGEKDIVPIFGTTLQDDKNPKAAPGHMLRDLGDFLQGKGGTRSELGDRFIFKVNAAEVQAIFVDEFQNAIESDSDRIVSNTANWVKSIVNLTKRPVVLFGMPWSKVVIDSSTELINRFEIIHHLEEYDRDNFDDWLKFLEEVNNQLPFEKSSNLNEPELALRLLAASKGNLSKLMKGIIKPAARIAYKQGASSISVEHLLKAAVKTQRIPKKINPLSVKNMLIDDIEIVHEITERHQHKPYAMNPGRKYIIVQENMSANEVLSK
ncbi:MAG: energy-coupling factor transporter ATP-binding protein EcfA2, partial [Psychromonas sp.]